MSDKSIPMTQNAVLIREFGEPEVMIYQDDVAVPEFIDAQVLVKKLLTPVSIQSIIKLVKVKAGALLISKKISLIIINQRFWVLICQAQ